VGRYAKLNTCGEIFSPRNRAYVYGVLVALSPVGIFYGMISGDEAGIWLTVASTILGSSSTMALTNVPRADAGK
jgi:hypothetical protein